MGEFLALWNWDCVVASRSVPCVWQAAGLSRKIFGSIFAMIAVLVVGVFQLRDLLRPATSAGFSWRTARWAKGA